MSDEKDNIKTMPGDSPCGDAWGGSLMDREKSSGVYFSERMVSLWLA